jgi:hypothetical protein
MCIFCTQTIISGKQDGGICAQLIQNNSFQAYNVEGTGEYGPADKCLEIKL